MEAILAQQNNSSEKVKLRKACYNDEALVVNILCKSFENDPCLNWLLDKSTNPNKLKITMRYIFHNIMKVGYIFLTDNEVATALWKCEKKEKISFEFVSRNLKFLFQIGLKSVIRILKNENFSNKQYPKDEKYCHMYIIGVLPESQGKGYASLLLNPVLNEMKRRNHPVFIETANLKNVQIYLKKGFNLYNKWINNGFELFYLRT